MDDVRAVMDAVGSQRAVLFGISEGGPMSLLFAATYPQRTSALILYGSFARRAWAPDHPFGHRCAGSVRDAVRATGIDLRAGLHAGECELVGNKLAGIAVHIGARVAAHAAPGEILVSNTVRDLVAGSGLVFESRGTHTLKGVPGKWPLFVVTTDTRHANT
jgi:class 3 adenylate cyclase